MLLIFALRAFRPHMPPDLGVNFRGLRSLVARVTLSRLINGQAGISADMARRHEAWLGGPSAENWLRMQADYNLWQAMQQPAPKVVRAKAVAT